ncbi:MAG: hypothetical protein ACRDT6_19505 [Micromonosporaceae bacterium]
MELRSRHTGLRLAATTAVVAALILVGSAGYAEEASPSPEPGQSVASSAAPAPAESQTPEPPAASDSPARTPAESAQPRVQSADLSVAVVSSLVQVDSGIRQFRVDLENRGPDPAAEVSLAIDATRLRLGFGLSAPQGTPLGEAGTVTVEVRADTPDVNQEDNTAVTGVRLVAKGTELVALGEDLLGVEPGTVRSLEFGVLNSGTTTAKDLVVLIQLPVYLSFDDRYDNCVYRDERTAECRFDGEIPPYHVWTPSAQTPITVSLHPNAPGPVRLWMQIEVQDVGQVDEVSGHVVKGQVTGASAALLADPDRRDSRLTLKVTTTPQRADLAAIGATVTGKVGDALPVKVGVRNHGPNDFLPQSSNPYYAMFRMARPHGTLVTKAPYSCFSVIDGERVDWDNPGAPGGFEYRCFDPVPAGETVWYEFELTIISARTDGGEVDFDGLEGDERPGNDSAPLVVRVAGGTASPSVSPSASPGAGGGGGGLPVTGTPLAGLVGGGAAAVLLGIVLFLVGRWRRTPAAVTGE